MSTHVLHGAWSEADAWSDVVTHLTEAGHRVLAPDLPAHGADPTPPGAATLADYVAAVTATIAAAGEPVVLVGHSMAGTVISEVAERAPASAAARALAALRPDPLAPLGTPIEVTIDRRGSVPRTYVHTALDRCVSPASQREMVEAVGATAVHTLEAGHLAMLSQPGPLAALLAQS